MAQRGLILMLVALVIFLTTAMGWIQHPALASGLAVPAFMQGARFPTIEISFQDQNAGPPTTPVSATSRLQPSPVSEVPKPDAVTAVPVPVQPTSILPSAPHPNPDPNRQPNLTESSLQPVPHLAAVLDRIGTPEPQGSVLSNPGEPEVSSKPQLQAPSKPQVQASPKLQIQASPTAQSTPKAAPKPKVQLPLAWNPGHLQDFNSSFSAFVTAKLQSRPPFVQHLRERPIFPADSATHWYMQTDMSENPKDVLVYNWATKTKTATYNFTFAIDRDALHDALAPIAEESNEKLVIVTFANLKYVDVFMNWLVALNKLGIRNYCIFAIDPKSKEWLTAHQIPTFGTYMKQFAALWYARLIVLRALIEKGVTFIHSDTDAIWVQNPLPRFFTNPRQDMKYSQGTLAPVELSSKWGFVVCGGLYYIKATPFTRAVLQWMLEHLLMNPRVPLHATDQDSTNFALEAFGVQWHVDPNQTYVKGLFQRQFTCSKTEVMGTFEGEQVQVSLLPHHLFVRQQMIYLEKPFVLHLYTHGGPKQTDKKLLMLEKEGLNYMIPDWQNVTFPGDRVQWLSSLFRQPNNHPIKRPW